MSQFKIYITVIVISLLVLSTGTFAHCDSMNGPVVKAAKKALESGNPNYVLIWIRPNDQTNIKSFFDKVLLVRKLSEEARELADNYFFETVVRVHRAGEGEPYTGLKQADYHPPEAIEAADAAISKNSLSEVLKHIPEGKQDEVSKLFADLRSKTGYDINDLDAGRRYVEAYVHFIHYVEGLFSSKGIKDKETRKHLN